MRRRPAAQGRKDANHAELVKHWLSFGNTSWHDTHELTGGLDGIAGAFRICQRVEIKNPKAAKSDQALTPAERETFATWKGRPPVIWLTKTDVEATHLNLYVAATKVYE